ncbi:MAG TPA: cytochrome c [Bryobacteraceae bacterium]|jgi:mono/diheme cytochrome c family protein
MKISICGIRLFPAALFLLLGACLPISAQTQRTDAGANAQARPPAQQRRFNGGGRNYKEYPPEVLENGHKFFSQNCAFCHGANAKGGETGPDLLRSIIVLDDENGEKIGQVVLNGRPDKGMPKFSMTQEQISDIAAFLHDRIRAAALRGTYQILNILVGDPKAGEAYFNGAGGCSACHSVSGDLAHIGAKYDPVAIQQKIVMPREERYRARSAAPETAPRTVTVSLPSGEMISGKLDHIDDFTVALTDAHGDYHSFARDGETPKIEIHDSLQAHIDMLTKYTDFDIHNLTAYLVTLK